MTINLLAIGLAAVAGSSAVAVEDWRPSSSAGEARAYIDTETIRREGDLVHFWRDLRWGEPRSFSNGTRYDRFVTEYRGDCRARTLRSLSVLVKLGDELVLTIDEDGELESVRPGSTADVDLRAACFGEWPAAH
jgi:hypothetical protein